MRLKELHINNFKFFPKQDSKSPLLKIDGKNVLIYGENGSGKSTIYWALYTLLESSFKANDGDISKYFTKGGQHSLVNIFSSSTPNVHIKAVLVEGANTKEYKVSGDIATIQGIRHNNDVKESGMASDFLNYRALFKLHYANHSSENDLFEWLEYEVLPYIRITGGETFSERIKELRKGPQIVPNLNGDDIYANSALQFSANAGERASFRFYRQWDTKVKKWNKELKVFLKKIDDRANEILRNDFKEDFTIKLELVPPRYNIQNIAINPANTLENLRWLDPELKLFIPKFHGKRNAVNKPHSFLNEAKWTALGLSIRLAILEDTTYRPSPVDLKCLVMDDMLLSLDMSNRDVVLRLIFERYIADYQLIFLTHDRVFFEFIKMYIGKTSVQSNWKLIEMYEGKDKNNNPYPVLIDSDFSYSDKIQRYFVAKDFTTCALYIRKELESLVSERLPEEMKKNIEGKFIDLQVLWTKCKARYSGLGYVIPASVIDNFDQTKLVLLNPQAHHNLSYPVYKLELEKAISLIDDIRSHCPIPQATTIMSKGMKMRFSHPAHNYSMEFELLTDFRIDILAGAATTILPRCRILTWQYNGNEYWNFMTSAIGPARNPEHNLNRVKSTLTGASVPLGITDDIFLDNTRIVNGVWNLRQIVNETGVVI